MTDRAKSEYYADTIAFLARQHARFGYTCPNTKPGITYTLPTRLDVPEEHRLHAWYLDACHAAIASPDCKVALRSLLQATKYLAMGASVGNTERDSLSYAQQRIEAMLDAYEMSQKQDRA